MDFIEPCFGIGHNLSLICQMTSEDIKHQLIITQRGKQMQHANIQFHTILVRTPLSRARGIQRRYSPQEGTVHTQVSHNRLTQHSTDSNTRPLSASHWSGVSRDTVFTNTPTTQVCRLLLLTTGLRWCRITGRLL